MSKDKEIMTTKEVRYARQGQIPAFKIGTDWRFHRKYIERWIRQKLVSHMQSKYKKEIFG
jgi:hypothetical protein